VSELIKVGSKAPDFRAAASDDQTYHLNDVRAKHRVLLIFYPGNNTPG
jgi:peroxiredoxin